MERIGRATLCVLSLLSVIVEPARAACVPDRNHYALAAEFRRSLYVARVKVLEEIWLGENGKAKPLRPPFQFGNSRPWGFDPYLGVYYRVRVLETFRGTPAPTLWLHSENSTARFWLSVDDEVIAFVKEEKFDPPVGRALTLDRCGNSRSMTKAGDLLNQLRKLAGPPGEKVVGRVGVEPTTY